MILFILKRLFVIALTLLCLSFIVFSLVTIEPNLKKLALNQANMRMEEEAVQSWLEKNGYKRPILVQYTEWLGNAVTGDFGYSTHFRNPVNEVVWPKLGHTGILMFWVLLITIPISLVIGPSSPAPIGLPISNNPVWRFNTDSIVFEAAVLINP